MIEICPKLKVRPAGSKPSCSPTETHVYTLAACLAVCLTVCSG